MSSPRLAVIGGGPAGLATAMYAAMRGIPVVAFEAGAIGGQLVNLYPSKPVTNFPAQTDILSRDLARRLSDQARAFGADLREWEPVEQVAPDEGGFALHTPVSQVVVPVVVLALGLGSFSPRRLGLTGEDRFVGRGLAYRLPPIEEIDARRIVVVGGGDTALDTALSLQSVGHVTLIHRDEQFRAFAYSQRRLEEAGIDVIRQGEVVELRGDDSLGSIVVRVVGEGTRELPVDLLVVCIGQVPDLSGLEDWKLEIRGPQVEVDSAMQTSRPGLLAVGDFAAYPGKVRMIATAVAEGSTAAATAERYLKAATPAGPTAM